MFDIDKDVAGLFNVLTEYTTKRNDQANDLKGLLTDLSIRHRSGYQKDYQSEKGTACSSR